MQVGNEVTHKQVLDWYDAWNHRDWQAVEQQLASEFTCVDHVFRRAVGGKDHYLKYAREFAEGFPDGKITVDRIVGAGRNGEVMIVEYRQKGTQTGHLGLFAPTSLRCEFHFCDLLRFHNGKLVGCTTYGDLYGPLSDLGHIFSRSVFQKPAA